MFVSREALYLPEMGGESDPVILNSRVVLVENILFILLASTQSSQAGDVSLCWTVSFLTQPWWSVTWSQGFQLTQDLYSHMKTTSWKLHCFLFSAGKSLESSRFTHALPVRHANEANKRLIWWKYMWSVWILFNNEQTPNPLTLKAMKRTDSLHLKEGV